MPTSIPDFDLQRRFGGLARLFGSEMNAAMRNASVAVVGIGGVGSWAAEALARSGVGALTLIDLDHIAESNINRQVHALSQTLGKSKVQAMAERIEGIHPQCALTLIDDFLTPENVNEVLSSDLSVVLDCTDQIAAKIAMVLQTRQRQQSLVVCGGAGGKTDPLLLRSGDLSIATHDALLGRMRNMLRRNHGFPKGGAAGGKTHKRVPKMGVSVIWVDQPTILPSLWQQGGNPEEQTRESEMVSIATSEASSLQGLSCAGYGSSVTVTATMGLVAANEAIKQILSR